MIDPIAFYDALQDHAFNYFTGVPDSLLKELCSCITDRSENNHILAANEGNALAIACGYHIATGKYSVVYMQNSGLGNIVNPLLSLADEQVYQIPMLLIVGYRGEPGVKDEPQHVTQGELTLPLLDTLRVPYLLLDETYEQQLHYCRQYMETARRPIALVVKKGCFSPYPTPVAEKNPYPLSREAALETLITHLNTGDFIVSTTGKTSREIFELREKYHMDHGNDFLTVGSMGHASSLALGISLQTEHPVYCVDGDGAFLMHMGGLAIAAQNAKDNFKYILINNGCHESVGGQPTIANQLQICQILSGFGFRKVILCKDQESLIKGLNACKESGPIALVVYTNTNSRANLGRPTTTPVQNKIQFEKRLRNGDTYESIDI